MKILKLMAYYPPENVPSSAMEKNLETRLIADGFEIKVLTPYPTRGCDNETRSQYRGIESIKNGRLVIHRFPLFRENRYSILRAIRYIICNIKEYFLAIKEKDVDVIIAGSTPPTQVLLARSVGKKLNKPYVLRIQDVFPDSMVTAGMTKKGSLIWKIGTVITQRAYHDAARIMVIGEQMRTTLCEKGVEACKIVIARNWIDTNAVHQIERSDNPLFDEFELSRDKFYVVYAGNLGKMQNIRTLIRAAAELKDLQKLGFLIFGAGVERDAVVALADELGCNNVSFYPLQNSNRISYVYSLGDMSVILCQTGAGKTAVPSKTWSIMATGTPILASFDLDSELCEIISSNECGVCVPPDDVEALSSVIRKLYNDKELLLPMGVKGRQYVENYLSADVCMKIYVDCLADAGKQLDN
jgi:glycosyltransferase involved in cell wall biosynthesis